MAQIVTCVAPKTFLARAERAQSGGPLPERALALGLAAPEGFSGFDEGVCSGDAGVAKLAGGKFGQVSALASASVPQFRYLE